MQDFFTDINENAHSGTDLANILDKASESIRSGHMGEARPSYAIAGTKWIKVDNILDITQGLWSYMLYDGVNDIEILQIDPTAHTVTFGGKRSMISIDLYILFLTSDIISRFLSITFFL